MLPTAYPINTETKSIETPSGGSELEQINQTILIAYAIAVDYKQMLQLTEKKAATTFDELRKKYPLRREFQYYQLDYAGLAPAAKKVLRTLNFN